MHTYCLAKLLSDGRDRIKRTLRLLEDHSNVFSPDLFQFSVFHPLQLTAFKQDIAGSDPSFSSKKSNDAAQHG